jgi:hypothetical protein
VIEEVIVEATETEETGSIGTTTGRTVERRRTGLRDRIGQNGLIELRDREARDRAEVDHDHGNEKRGAATGTVGSRGAAPGLGPRNLTIQAETGPVLGHPAIGDATIVAEIEMKAVPSPSVE